jgi:hypothetical protein
MHPFAGIITALMAGIHRPAFLLAPDLCHIHSHSGYEPFSPPLSLRLDERVHDLAAFAQRITAIMHAPFSSSHLPPPR